MAANDDPTNPAHYHMAIEPWDFIVANQIGYCEGNVIKYVCRWRAKNGVIDLRKARNYIDRLIVEAEKEANNGRTKETIVSVPLENGQHEDRMCTLCGGDCAIPCID